MRLKKTLRFSDDEDDAEDEGTQRAVLGSMVFPSECYDDDDAWIPLTPRNTRHAQTPRKVSTMRVHTHTHTRIILYMYINTPFHFSVVALHLLLFSYLFFFGGFFSLSSQKPTCQSSEKRRGETGQSPIVDRAKARPRDGEKRERARENKENLAVTDADGGVFALPAPVTPASNRKSRTDRKAQMTPVNNNVIHKPVETPKGEFL